MKTPEDVAQAPAGGWRFKLGIGIICVMLGSWAMVPIAASLGLAGSKVAALTGALFISNKILLILVIAVMGKAGFQRVKRSLFGYVSGLAPSADVEVGPVRHAIGIVMFCLPLISSVLEPYVDTLWPGLRPNVWQIQLLGDAMLIGSFFVLGGSFWDKVRALFMRNARVVTGQAG